MLALGLLEDMFQDQFLTVACHGPPGMGYKVICRCCYLCWAQRYPGEAMLLVPRSTATSAKRGLLNKRYRLYQSQMLLICSF